ncbi:interleukin-36 alpha-like [Antechinus flavipes]|uniref:interleukin-36 alpha-like n=1 Tax=Antechinus flavipes TaxID=38775 RepID=UPI00223577F7|nr:interleukin-36 alpha-like [Antechinus flavipes]
MDSDKSKPMFRDTVSIIHLRDTNQQVLILQNNILIASPHSDYVTPVTFASLPCRDIENLEKDKGTPIYLGIHGKELCLCCEESGGEPTLKLKEKNLWKLYQSKDAEKPFVFYQNQNGSTSSLESAAYPGWFICTSSELNRPVRMTQQREPNCNTSFYLSE